jgi:hypothetical protein
MQSESATGVACPSGVVFKERTSSAAIGSMLFEYDTAVMGEAAASVEKAPV